MIRLGLVGGFPSEDRLAGLYRLDVSAGSYRLDRIGIGLGFARRNWL